MAKVSKLKNEGGSPVEVQDYDLKTLQSQTAKTASEVSTTAQYVPLQDINGNIVKISMQSMQEAMRNVLGSLLINNDKGTSITGIAGLSGSGSSIDFGSITPANLASLLGGIDEYNALAQVVRSGNIAGAFNSPTTYGTIVKFRAYYNCYICIAYNGTRIWISADSGSGTTDDLTWHEITLQS